jgi:hypothetical protein
MYLFNIVILLLNSQLQYKYLVNSKSHNILFTTIDDIDYGDDIESLPPPPPPPSPIPIPKPLYNHNINSVIGVNSFDDKYYKKRNGYDERYANDNTIEQFINNKLLLNKIDAFFNNKKLLDRLLQVIKQRNDTLERVPFVNPILYHQYESDVFDQVRQYSNDNRNKSELTDNIFAGGLLNDW